MALPPDRRRSGRRGSTAWLKKGQTRPVWVFASTAGTALDESNVRKAFNQILDKAELHRRGPHQLRHTFGSLLINVGEPVTYVSRQLGHKDSAITLKVYARWLPDETRRRGVDRLDETQPSATPAQPDQKIAVGENPVSRWQESGEPPRNRTENPQIKSLLLCQLS